MDDSRKNTLIIAMQKLSQTMSGSLKWGSLDRALYATDASVYRELPFAVAWPKSTKDLQLLVEFSNQFEIPLIPRAAGTSLAGQVVGSGLVVDVSKHMDQIIELNRDASYVWVRPGVVRDALNVFLKPHGLFFGPNTSTANRATIGGMVGNNSCGSTSIVYGSTRDHVLALRTILSDGTLATFESLSTDEIFKKQSGDNLESELYRNILTLLSQKEVQQNILQEYPKRDIKRRNTGYAIDALIDMVPFQDDGRPFNFCELLCGSEGTLAITTAIKLNLVPLPAPESVLLAVHFDDIIKSLEATVVMMEYQPSACELMDKTVLDCTKNSPEFVSHRFFIEGNPEAVIMLEFRDESLEGAKRKATAVQKTLSQNGMGYAYPILTGEDAQSIWELRKAGLGLLALLPGDEKAVACIEDTAVSLPDLPEYITQFSRLMANFGQKTVYYAHAGAGELHLRPILDLKTTQGKKQFRDISSASADLVKSFHGSLSGEHGDGRVRSEFIPKVIGENNYQILEHIKATWDPKGLFNPGKIISSVKMDEQLRTDISELTKVDTVLNFGHGNGLLRAAEMCNGSGDCLKQQFAGGTMCPSYRITKNERDSTRGRANVLREFLTTSNQENPLNHPEIKEAMSLCVGCKACVKECPSAVDMTALKAEFLHQFYKNNKRSKRDLMIARSHDLNNRMRPIAPVINWVQSAPFLSALIKQVLGFHPKRSLPLLQSQRFTDWLSSYSQPKCAKAVYLFADEFLEDYDKQIGIDAIQLFNAMGFEVRHVPHFASGRAQLSKGFLDEAKELSEANLAVFAPIITAQTPLVGIEPSAILGFRDEYPRLVNDGLKEIALELAKNVFTIDEFLAQAIISGDLHRDLFIKKDQEIVLHAHCHQKALSKSDYTKKLLEVPHGYKVSMAPSGCCGMAGAFGYEQEHYDSSMKMGELGILPHIRRLDSKVIIAATGTSCRHQIKDGTGRISHHPVTILRAALR